MLPLFFILTTCNSILFYRWWVSHIMQGTVQVWGLVKFSSSVRFLFCKVSVTSYSSSRTSMGVWLIKSDSSESSYKAHQSSPLPRCPCVCHTGPGGWTSSCPWQKSHQQWQEFCRVWRKEKRKDFLHLVHFYIERQLVSNIVNCFVFTELHIFGKCTVKAQYELIEEPQVVF